MVTSKLLDMSLVRAARSLRAVFQEHIASVSGTVQSSKCVFLATEGAAAEQLGRAAPSAVLRSVPGYDDIIGVKFSCAGAWSLLHTLSVTSWGHMHAGHHEQHAAGKLLVCWPQPEDQEGLHCDRGAHTKDV